jgi:hypothetical protein
MARTDESYHRAKAATIERHKSRYASDPAYRAKCIADAKAWYYANRERVLARIKAKRLEARAPSD